MNWYRRIKNLKEAVEFRQGHVMYIDDFCKNFKIGIIWKSIYNYKTLCNPRPYVQRRIVQLEAEYGSELDTIKKIKERS